MKTWMYYYIPFSARIEDMLIEHNIAYQKDSSWDDHLKFEFYKENAPWEKIKDILPPPNVTEFVFSKKELEQAKWLTMRSTNMKFDSMNEKTIRYYCPNNVQQKVKSGFHEEQFLPFEFSTVKWKNNNHFYSSYTGGYEIIFCDDYAKNILQENNISGIRFDPVLKFKKGIPLENVSQLVFENILGEDALILDKEVTPLFCPTCGKKKYSYTRNFRLTIQESCLDEDMDCYATPCIFSLGNSYGISPYLIVSQKIYTVLKEAELIRNLKFEPIILVPNDTEDGSL